MLGARAVNRPDGRNYRAVHVAPDRSRDELVRLWADNLAVVGDLHAKLDWLYLANPSGPGEAFVLRDAGDAAVGCAGITPRELWRGDRVLRVALLADFAIDRPHRTGLPALVLQRATKQHVEAGYELGYGFPNASAVAIHRRIGFFELGGMARYVRVLRHGGYIARRYGRPTAARVAGAIVDAAKLVVRWARAARPVLNARLVWRDDVDPRFDELWQRSRGQWGIACRRDAAFLHWRFVAKPVDRVRIATLVARGGDRLLAYAIVGGRPGDMAHVHDLFGPLDAIGDLLTLLVPSLTLAGHTAVSMRYLGDPRMAELLIAHGMSPRDADRKVIACLPARCTDAALRDAATWYLTDLDEDA